MRCNRARRTYSPHTVGPFTVEEIEEFRLLLLGKVQLDAYREEIKDTQSGRSVGKNSQ